MFPINSSDAPPLAEVTAVQRLYGTQRWEGPKQTRFSSSVPIACACSSISEYIHTNTLISGLSCRFWRGLASPAGIFLPLDSWRWHGRGKMRGASSRPPLGRKMPNTTTMTTGRSVRESTTSEGLRHKNMIWLEYCTILCFEKNNGIEFS